VYLAEEGNASTENNAVYFKMVGESKVERGGCVFRGFYIDGGKEMEGNRHAVEGAGDAKGLGKGGKDQFKFEGVEYEVERRMTEIGTRTGGGEGLDA
jgi:hypothetical protein